MHLDPKAGSITDLRFLAKIINPKDFKFYFLLQKRLLFKRTSTSMKMYSSKNDEDYETPKRV
jgi:hypothetical protein